MEGTVKNEITENHVCALAQEHGLSGPLYHKRVVKYRPTLDMVSENESCDGAEDSCCKETKEDFVVCDHY
ncbi:hypothetical protein D917_05086, partial [Trichinella nativa]